MNILRRPEPQLPEAATGSKQTVQARHGTATYVPKGYTIRIINTYGRQVVDTWAFALHAPPTAEEMEEDAREEEQFVKEDEAAEEGDATQAPVGEEGHKELTEETQNKAETEEKVKSEPIEEEKAQDQKAQDQKEEEEGAKPEDSEKVEEQKAETEKGEGEIEKPVQQQETDAPPEEAKDKESKDLEKISDENEGKSPTSAKGWSAYIPSVRGIGKKNTTEKPEAEQPTDEKEMTQSKTWGSYLSSLRIKKSNVEDGEPKEQRTWASYIPSGKAFNSYIPKNTISSFAAMHQRDPSKSVAEQLYDFSKTPVGAAGISAATGSGYASSLYAVYTAYNRTTAARSDSDAPGMEFLSMTHTRASTQHMSPRVGDTLVTNLRAPLLTVVEDTSPGTHDTLMAACDPLRYKELQVEKWEEHGSCAENLVLALRELNQQVGLKGRKAIGSDVTVNNVPSPLNLFMNIPWTNEGDLNWDPPKGKRGDYVKLRAERDCIVVMSACPQDVTEINGKKPMVAHFIVDSPTEADEKTADEQEKKAQEIIEKAKRRAEGEWKQPQSQGPARPTSQTPSQTQAQTGLRNRPKPLASRRSSQSSGQRSAPRKLNRSTSSRKPNAEVSPALKETQRVESPPPRRQPVPVPGKKAPKKLERRGASSNSIPRP